MALSHVAVSSVLSSLASVPWLEEALLIVSIGVAFVLTHKVGVKSMRRPAKAHKHMFAEDEEEEEEEEEAEEEEGPSYGSGRVQARAARRARAPAERREYGAGRAPQTSAELPGVTDRRFAGRIVYYKEDEGYGFISCPELYPRFHRDVFLHSAQVGSFVVGASVRFGVFLNKSGQPQAKELEARYAFSPFDAMAWDDWDVRAEEPLAPPEPVVKRQPLNPYAKPFEALNPYAKPFEVRAGAVPARRAASADPSSWSAAAEPEATWRRWPAEPEASWEPEATWERWPAEPEATWKQRPAEPEATWKQWPAEPEATWKQQRPLEWNEWGRGERHWAPVGQSGQDPKGGEKRWVPKAQPHAPAAAAHGKLQWVPKKTAASGSADEQ